MEKKQNTDNILISVYVKIPMNTTAQKLYENLLMAAIVNRKTGVIVESDISFASNIAKEFVENMINGVNLNDDINILVNQVEKTYYGHLKKSLITGLRMLHREFAVVK